MLVSKTKTNVIEDDEYKSAMAATEKFFAKKCKIQCKAEHKHETFTVSLRKMENYKRSLVLMKKSPSDNCCFAISKRRCRSVSPPSPITDNLSKLQTAKIQTLKHDNPTKCKKLLRCNGYPHKVLLYPEESWAKTAASSYWTLSPTWWNYNRCKVVEVTGTKRYTTQAKMVETDSGNLYIIGSFKKCADPDFKLILTANITIADFNMGYCMTGSLERGSHKLNNYQTTHFAVVKRAEFNV